MINNKIALSGLTLWSFAIVNLALGLDIETKRFEGNPILSVEIIGGEAYDVHRETNSAEYISIAGPSLIQVPNWIDKPLGKYYLYFHTTRESISAWLMPIGWKGPGRSLIPEKESSTWIR